MAKANNVMRCYRILNINKGGQFRGDGTFRRECVYFSKSGMRFRLSTLIEAPVGSGEWEEQGECAAETAINAAMIAATQFYCAKEAWKLGCWAFRAQRFVDGLETREVYGSGYGGV